MPEIAMKTIMNNNHLPPMKSCLGEKGLKDLVRSSKQFQNTRTKERKLNNSHDKIHV